MILWIIFKFIVVILWVKLIFRIVFIKVCVVEMGKLVLDVRIIVIV